MTGETRSTVGARTLLANASIRRIWLAHSISQFGDGLTSFAAFILISKLTGSATAVAVMAIALAFPQLAVGLFAGVFVDRWDRKRVMVVTDLLRAALVPAFMLVRRPEDVWIFYVVGFAQATVATFFGPARSALIPTLVGKEGLLAANGLFESSGIVTRILGTGTAGVLVGVAGGGALAFGLDAMSFLISALLVARATTPPPEAPPAGSGGATSVLRELGDGLRLVVAERVLIGTLAALAATNFAVSAASVIFVPFMSAVLHVRTEAMGVVELAEALGGAAGSVAVTAFAGRLDARRWMVLGVSGVGVMLAVIGGAPNFAFAVAATFTAGLGLGPISVASATLLQVFAPGDKRGRVASAMNTVFAMGQLAAMGAAGVLGDVLGLRIVFLIVGALTAGTGVGAGVLMKSSPRAREIR
jgi:MFS family permease